MSVSPASSAPSLRAALLGLTLGALAYVALLGVFIVIGIRPSAERLRSSSQAVLAEYQESTGRIARLDSTLADLWSLLGTARREPIGVDTLTHHRLVLQGLAASARGVLRIGTETGGDSVLRRILSQSVADEDQLRGIVLGAIASLELGEVEVTERLLRRADSLDAPLYEALAGATSAALQRVVDDERDLATTVGLMNGVAWAWLAGGLLTVPLLARFFRRRLAHPLARLERGLDRLDAGDLEVSLPVGHHDEIGRLVDHFNRTTALLRRRAEDDQRRAEDRTVARTRAVIDAALDAVIVADVEGRIKEWSPQAAAVFGWEREEVVDRLLADTIVPVRHREAHVEGMSRFARTGVTRILNRRLELTAMRKDGSEFPVELTISPLAEGDQAEFSAFIRDITDRRAAQAALAQSESRYRTAFEEATVGMVEIGLDGRYLRVNRAFAEMVGRSPGELVGTSFADITHPADREADVAAFGRLTRGTSSVRREKRYLRPDGTVANAQVSTVPVRDAGGTPLYALTVAEDVTARRLLEERLRQTHKMDAVGQLAGGVAHDFNNLLTAIIGYADLLRRTEDLPPEVAEDATAILATAERGADLARNLLTLSREAPAREQGVDFHDVVREVRDIAARTFDRRITLQVDPAARVSIVTGDRSMLVNALLNLALNARDAMLDGGRLTISTRDCQLTDQDCERHGGLVSPGDYLAVRVEDTGVGMSDQIRERIFEPFFTTKPVGKGTGIGLAMVYGTVRSHRGVIEAVSVEGHGTTFTIYLPIRAGDAVPRDRETAAIQYGTGRILLADDDGMVREVATRMLQRLGYDVELAVDGAEAVAKVAEMPDRYELIILDGNMPRMTGREAAMAIAKAAPTVPLVLASGYLETGEAEKLAAYGFTAAISKPYNLSELSRVVASRLHGSA